MARTQEDARDLSWRRDLQPGDGRLLLGWWWWWWWWRQVGTPGGGGGWWVVLPAGGGVPHTGGAAGGQVAGTVYGEQRVTGQWAVLVAARACCRSLSPHFYRAAPVAASWWHIAGWAAHQRVYSPRALKLRGNRTLMTPGSRCIRCFPCILQALVTGQQVKLLCKSHPADLFVGVMLLRFQVSCSVSSSYADTC